MCLPHVVCVRCARVRPGSWVRVCVCVPCAGCHSQDDTVAWPAWDGGERIAGLWKPPSKPSHQGKAEKAKKARNPKNNEPKDANDSCVSATPAPTLDQTTLVGRGKCRTAVVFCRASRSTMVRSVGRGAMYRYSQASWPTDEGRGRWRRFPFVCLLALSVCLGVWVWLVALARWAGRVSSVFPSPAGGPSRGFCCCWEGGRERGRRRGRSLFTVDLGESRNHMNPPVPSCFVASNCVDNLTLLSSSHLCSRQVPRYQQAPSWVTLDSGVQPPCSPATTVPGHLGPSLYPSICRLHIVPILATLSHLPLSSSFAFSFG